MKKRSGPVALELPLDGNENADQDLGSLEKEREQLLKALERIKHEKQNLQRKTNRLMAKAKSLNCILARTHPTPEYLKREE